MVLLQRKLYFSKDTEGVQHFSGEGGGGRVQLFPGGNAYNSSCDFPEGGTDPLSLLLDPHMAMLGVIDICEYAMSTD